MASSTNMSNGAPKTVICVFCGASPGTTPDHLAAARALGEVLHKNNISLVYGGGTAGLMGEVARTLVSLSGPSSVHGIIPRALVKHEKPTSVSDPSTSQVLSQQTFPQQMPQILGGSLQQHASPQPYGRTTIVEDMHTRKALMAKEVMTGGPGSGFIALSGGYGTLEELMEIVTWNQLGIHDKGIVVLNVSGFWDGLLKWVADATNAGFVKEANKRIFVEAKTAEEALECLRDYKVSEERLGLSWEKS